MNELLRLLGLCENDAIQSMTDEQLSETLSGLREESAALVEAEPDDEQLAALRRARDAVQAIESLQATRSEQAATRAADIAELRSTFRPANAQAANGGDQPGGEPGAGDGGDDDGATTPEPGDGGDADETTTAGADGDIDRLIHALSERLAASAQPMEVADDARISNVNARRPAAMRPRVPVAPDLTHLPITASANVPGVPAGAVLDTPLKLAKTIVAAYNATKGYKGPRTLIKVAKIGGDDPREMYGEDRTLSPEDTLANREKIEATMQTIRASGGPCAPINTSYDIPELGTDARPMRDTAMTRFGADRGGVKTIPPASLADVGGSVALWTMTNDTNPSNPAHKPCVTMTCPAATTDVVEAITRCIQVGNFRNLFFPEQVQDWVNKAAIVHARTAEQELIHAVAVGSSQVTFGAEAGAALDVLTNLDRAVAAYEYRHRLGDDHPPLRFVAPLWLTDLIRSDITRQAHRGTIDEQYALADTNIERWIQSRNLNVTWLLDGEAGQGFGPQGDGPGPSWPPFAVCYLYGEGEWLFLDGGTIDLGIVRDSVTNSTNDFQLFFESMEGAHFHGYESQRLAMYLCPDGSTGIAKTLNVCSSGS